MGMGSRRGSNGLRAFALAGQRPPVALGWLVCAVLALIAALLVGCSGGSSEKGSAAGVTVQRIATPTTRLAASATKAPASPTARQATSTVLPATPTAGPTLEPTAEPASEPATEAPTAAPNPPSTVPLAGVGVTLSPPEIPQGGATVVQVASASAATAVADFADRQYPLLASQNVFWGVLGVPGNEPPGAYPVLVTLVTADGRTLRQLEASLTVTTAGFPVEYVQLEPSVAALLDPAIVLEEIDHRAAIYSAFTPERLWSGPFLLPVQGPITGVYGAGRSYNGGPVTDYHRGTDIMAEEGTPVVAANTGRVVFAGDLAVRGRSVILDHGAGVFSAYHHLSTLAVVEGQLVTKGDLIGAVGHTGLAEGPHLHWEIVVRGVEVDALLWTQVEYGPLPPG
jgi:murein DD-endopeptidase MepM/ murein hydrolase activator NlpD